MAIEARGFGLGALAAHALGVGLILARKPGAIHPGAVEHVAEDPDWRGRRLTFGISPQAVRPDDRLLLVDDWVETGSQARTVASLVTGLGGTLVGVSAVIDHANVDTRRELGLVGLLRSTELPRTREHDRDVIARPAASPGHDAGASRVRTAPSAAGHARIVRCPRRTIRRSSAGIGTSWPDRAA